MDELVENQLREASAELMKKAETIFNWDGINEESIAEVKEHIASNYKSALPENLRGKYFPVLGLKDDELMLGWRDISLAPKYPNPLFND